WDEMAAIVARAIAARPRAMQRQLALFLILLEWFPLVRYGRRLSRLDPARRTKFLDRLQRSPLLLLRRGFWGVRTLVLMGYYGRPAAAAEIGYRAAFINERCLVVEQGLACGLGGRRERS